MYILYKDTDFLFVLFGGKCLWELLFSLTGIWRDPVSHKNQHFPSPCVWFFSWLSALESTKWLHHLSVLLKSALLVVHAVDRDQRPVLAHCSDGWDRTPQIVALAKLLLDPYYRTIEVGRNASGSPGETGQGFRGSLGGGGSVQSKWNFYGLESLLLYLELNCGSTYLSACPS